MADETAFPGKMTQAAGDTAPEVEEGWAEGEEPPS